MPFELVKSMGFMFVKKGLLVCVIVTILCFMPIIGNLLISMPGLAVFLQGVLVARPFLSSFYLGVTGSKELPDGMFPSFINCIGYFIIAFILIYLVSILLALVTNFLRPKDPLNDYFRRYSNDSSNLEILFSFFIGPAMGVIPIIMFCKYFAARVAI